MEDTSKVVDSLQRDLRAVERSLTKEETENVGLRDEVRDLRGLLTEFFEREKDRIKEVDKLRTIIAELTAIVQNMANSHDSTSIGACSLNTKEKSCFFTLLQNIRKIFTRKHSTISKV